MAVKCGGLGSMLSVAEKQKGHEYEYTRGRMMANLYQDATRAHSNQQKQIRH